MKFPALILPFLFLTNIFYSPENHNNSEDTLKPFQGTVVYSIEYIEVPKEVEGMESMLPQETIMSVSGDLVRVEQDIMGGSQIILVDNQKKESHVIMNLMGQKLDVFLSKEEIEAAEDETPDMKVEELTGSKKILGYRCRKALITNPDTGDTQTVYYTKKLEIEHKDFKNLKGFPLEYYTSQQGMKIKMTATSVTRKNLPAFFFEVPDGYTRMTMEELTEMMGGN